MSKFCTNIFLIQTTSNYLWHPSLLSTSSQIGHHHSCKLHQIYSFLWAFSWYHSQKEGRGAFLGQDQMGPALPPILAAIPPPEASKFKFWAIEGSLCWLPKEFFGIEGSVAWFLRPLLTVQVFCCLNF